MKNALNHKITKVIFLVLCAILPCAFFVALFFGAYDNTMVGFLEKNLYNLLWCGWYGCVLVCLTFQNKWTDEQSNFIVLGADTYDEALKTYNAQLPKKMG
mgnify:CR=1 FL=1